MAVLRVYNCKSLKGIKTVLQEGGHYDSQRRICEMSDGDSHSSTSGSYAVPITLEYARELEAKLEQEGGKLPLPFEGCDLITISGDGSASSSSSSSSSQLLAPLPPPSKGQVAKRQSEHEMLLRAARSLLVSEGGLRDDEQEVASLLTEVPKNWIRHGDLIVLPRGSFSSSKWRQFSEKLWRAVSLALRCQRVAVGSKVACDCFRSSGAGLVLGADGWVRHRENGVIFVFDVTRCMFSAGNVTEKLRLSRLNCRGETVVDMYAGIGYFTLPFLVHSEAAVVHACEWNAHALEALERGLSANGVSDRCVVHRGDCRKVAPKGIAHRVNLGLLPSSEEAWPAACEALTQDQRGAGLGVWLHIHGNVCSKPGTQHYAEFNQWVEPGHKGLKTANQWVEPKHKGLKTAVQSNQWVEPKQKGLTDLVSHKDGFLSGTEENLYEQSQPQPSCVNSGSQATTRRKFKVEAWERWAEHVATSIRQLLGERNPAVGLGGEEGGSRRGWEVCVRHLERVKSYAPHVDHLVADVECKVVDRSVKD